MTMMTMIIMTVVDNAIAVVDLDDDVEDDDNDDDYKWIMKDDVDC